MARLDPHSWNDTDHPEVEFVDWRARVEFASRTIEADVALTIRGEGPFLDLDTQDLAVDSITDDGGQPLPFAFAPPDPILGARLRVELRPFTRTIRIRY